MVGVQGCDVEVLSLVPLAQVPEFLVSLWEHDITLASTYASVTSHKHFPDHRPNRHNRRPAGPEGYQTGKSQHVAASSCHFQHSESPTRTLIAPDTDVGSSDIGDFGASFPDPHDRWL